MEALRRVRATKCVLVRPRGRRWWKFPLRNTILRDVSPSTALRVLETRQLSGLYGELHSADMLSFVDLCPPWVVTTSLTFIAPEASMPSTQLIKCMENVLLTSTSSAAIDKQRHSTANVGAVSCDTVHPAARGCSISWVDEHVWLR
jgi:hypothetical protein